MIASGLVRRILFRMSTAPQYQPHYTIADYRQWEGRWELWNGIAVAMTPSPAGRHARLLVDVAALLKAAVDAAGTDCEATVLAEIDWIVATDTVVRPDLVIVCGAEPPGHVEQPPALVVEILSPATRQRDLTVKRDLYAASGVGWYLIIDPEWQATGTEPRKPLAPATLLRLRGGSPPAYAEWPAAEPVELCDHCRLVLALDQLAG